MENMEQYLKAVIATFDVDPPDNDFHAGYLAAYQTMLDELPLVKRGQAVAQPVKRERPPGIRLVKLAPGVDGESAEH